MKFDRTVFFKTVSLIAVFGSLLYGAAAGIDAKKQMGKNIFYISPILNEPARYFSLDDITAMETGALPLMISYESVSESEVSFDKTKVYAKTTKTNNAYFSLNHLHFTNGGSWTERMQNEKVAVINESLAWQLFGGLSVTGGEIGIGGDHYTIAGVVADGKLSKESAALWLPYTGQSNENGISSLLIQPAAYNPLGSYKAIGDLLNDIDKSDRLYHVTDLNRYADGIAARYKILFFLIGIYGILFTGYILYAFIRGQSRQLRGRRLLPTVLMALCCFAIIVLLWQHIQFDLWIPKFSGTAFDQLRQAVFNDGLLPPDAYLSAGVLALSRLNAAATNAFLIGCIGVVNFISVGGLGRGGDRH